MIYIINTAGLVAITDMPCDFTHSRSRTCLHMATLSAPVRVNKDPIDKQATLTMTSVMHIHYAINTIDTVVNLNIIHC